MTRRIRIFLPLLLVLAAFQTHAQITSELRILRIDATNYPKVKVYVRLYCNGVPVNNFQSYIVNAKDGGINRNYTLTCPQQKLPISVALCLDNSGSVAGTSIVRIRQGATDFVNLMQHYPTGDDEAAVISFNYTPQLEMTMTSNKAPLINAIAGLMAYGNTAVWDAVALSIDEVVLHGHNARKAVLVLSDGGDNNSKDYTLEDVIAHANSEGIPVYCIGIGYGERWFLWQLQELADRTGGQYFEVNSPEEIVGVFNAMASVLTGGQNECVIEYNTECPDGSEREVTITTDACGGLTAKAKYRVPVDPRLAAINVTLDSVSVYSGASVDVPVWISASPVPAPVKKLAFTLNVPTPLIIDSVSVVNCFGELFANTISVNGSTIDAGFIGSQTLSGKKKLMVLKLRAPVMDRDSSVRLTIPGYSKETDTCMALVVKGVGARIIPRAKLKVACNQTLTTEWNDSTFTYQPDIITVATIVTNTSRITSKKTRIRVLVPYGLQQISGSEDFIIAGDSIKPYGQSTVTLAFRVLPTDTARTLRVCIEASADSGNAVWCCSDVKVAVAKPSLRAWCTIPSYVKWDSVNRRYDPESFPVTVRITNLSPVSAKNVQAKISLPNGFRLSFGVPATVPLSPPTITRSDTAGVTWIVTVLERPNSGSVHFCATVTANNDTMACCQDVFIESSPVRATLACGDPVLVVYDEESGTFERTAFSISSAVHNKAGFPMEGVWARITLPPFLRLAAGEPDMKYPGNSYIGAFDSARVGWNLTVTGTDRSEDGVICINVSANNFPGAECCVPARLVFKSAVPTLACTLRGPDTIRYLGDSYVPNPADLTVEVTNIGMTTAKRVTAALLQGEDVSIDSADVALKVLTDSLQAGIMTDGRFALRILPRNISRFDTVRVTVYADNGGAVVCEKIIWIEAVARPSLLLTCTAPDSLQYDDFLAKYRPGPFLYTLTAVNTGPTRMDSVSAEVLLPPNTELVAGEEAVRMMTPQALAPGDTAVVSWLLNAVPRPFGRMDTVRATVRYRGMIADAVAPCGAALYVPPARRAQLAPACAIDGVIVAAGDHFDPDSIRVLLTVGNTGDAIAYNVTAELIADARIPLAPGEQAVKSTATIDPVTGSASFAWTIRPRTTAAGDSINVCMRIAALRQPDLFCCALLVLPNLDQSGIRVTCAAPDTVYYDPVLKGYANPITLATTVSNPTTVATDTIRTSVILPRDFTLAAGEAREKVIAPLNPGAQQGLQWLLDAISDTSRTPRTAVVRIQYFAGGALVTCDRSIVIMPVPGDSTQMELACTSPDRIHFVNAETGLDPSPFTFTVEIRNTGSVLLHNVSATLRLPDGLDLAAGEQLTKQVTPVLDAGLRTAASWTIVPRQSYTPLTANFLVFVNCAELPEHRCQTTTLVDPIRRLVIFTLPVGTVGRTGQSVTIPLNVANPDHVPLRAYTISVSYDPALVSPTGAISEGTLTSGWPLADLTITTPGSFTLRGGSSAPSTQDGVLQYLVFHVLSGDGTPAPFGVKHSDLIFTGVSVADTADVVTTNGDIWTTGDCLTGLEATGSYQLFQNVPNPFNPATVIRYFIPGTLPQYITLELYDMYGRSVRRLESGYRAAGMQETVFQAADLPAGTYFYMLRAGGVNLLKRMVLLK